jgi:hypothetical protein
MLLSATFAAFFEFSLIHPLVLVLCAAAIAKLGGSFSSLSFLLFTGIWGILSVIFLLVTPIALPALHHNFIVLGVEFLAMIFFFAGFIAVAAFIGTPDCDGLGWCQCIQAGIAFGAFSWVLWVVTLALVVREVYLEHSGNVSRGPTAGGVEAMKDGPVPMESHNNGTPMSNPNL